MKKEEVMEVKQDLNSRFGKEVDKTLEQKHRTSFWGFPTVEEMRNNKCFCCLADRYGNRCLGKEFCNATWRRYNAIVNPEWHHVRLADIDFDKKKKVYLAVYRELQQKLSYLQKCKTQDTYDTCFIRYIQRINFIYANGKISNAMFNFIKLKLSMQNVKSGVWASDCEAATGYHKSRRYNKNRVGR